MSQRQMRLTLQPAASGSPAVGVPGHLALLAGALGLALLAPTWLLFLAVLLGAAALAGRPRTARVPETFRPLVHTRWLVLGMLLILPSIFLGGPLDRQFLGLAYSAQGLATAVQALLRMLLIYLAASVFTAAVEISALSGVFERMGLHGLGFSLGVAMNLLPGLQQSASTRWNVLRMRGGLRRQRWQGLRLLAIAVLSQALSRAEEIALAAEVRAYTPARAQAYPVTRGALDGWVIAGSALAVAAALLIRFL